MTACLAGFWFWVYDLCATGLVVCSDCRFLSCFIVGGYVMWPVFLRVGVICLDFCGFCFGGWVEVCCCEHWGDLVVIGMYVLLL